MIDASLWVGYVWADEPRSGATVVVTGTDQDAIKQSAEAIARDYWQARHEFTFAVSSGDADWCIEQGLAGMPRPVVISDSGDNPTAGGVGDVPYMLERLLAHRELVSGARTAILASIVDPAAVAARRRASRRAPVEIALGGKLDHEHGQPVPIHGSVTAVVERDDVGGDLAVIQTGGISVIVTSRREPFHHIADFTELGLDPLAVDLVVVKIGYLEPELHALAKEAYLALTPGAVNQDIPSLTHHRVRRPMYPLDPEMSDPPLTATLFPPRQRGSQHGRQ